MQISKNAFVANVLALVEKELAVNDFASSTRNFYVAALRKALTTLAYPVDLKALRTYMDQQPKAGQAHLTSVWPRAVKASMHLSTLIPTAPGELPLEIPPLPALPKRTTCKTRRSAVLAQMSLHVYSLGVAIEQLGGGEAGVERMCKMTWLEWQREAACNVLLRERFERLWNALQVLIYARWHPTDPNFEPGPNEVLTTLKPEEITALLKSNGISLKMLQAGYFNDRRFVVRTDVPDPNNRLDGLLEGTTFMMELAEEQNAPVRDLGRIDPEARVPMGENMVITDASTTAWQQRLRWQPPLRTQFQKPLTDMDRLNQMPRGSELRNQLMLQLIGTNVLTEFTKTGNLPNNVMCNKIRIKYNLPLPPDAEMDEEAILWLHGKEAYEANERDMAEAQWTPMPDPPPTLLIGPNGNEIVDEPDRPARDFTVLRSLIQQGSPGAASPGTASPGVADPGSPTSALGSVPGSVPTV